MMRILTLLDFLSFLQCFLNTRSEVSNNFQHCLNKFYQNTPPILNGLTKSIQICQRHRRLDPYFATNYNSKNRIPYYSAYLIDSFHDDDAKRRDIWFLEPQLVDRTFQADIVREKYISEQRERVVINPNRQLNVQNQHMIMENVQRNYRNGQDNDQEMYLNSQAMSKDYKSSDKDDTTRGHLNPNFYNSYRLNIDARDVTNSLTNIAPQDRRFNSGIWNKLETSLYKAMHESCNFAGARRYFITGVIPSTKKYISNGRVNVPDYYWTAMCCDSSAANRDENRMTGWSAAFLGQNIPKSSIYVYTIENFLHFLARKTSSRRPQLFADYAYRGTNIRNCLFSQTKATTEVDKIIQKNNKFYKQTYFNRVFNKLYSTVADRLG